MFVCEFHFIWNWIDVQMNEKYNESYLQFSLCSCLIICNVQKNVTTGMGIIKKKDQGVNDEDDDR